MEEGYMSELLSKIHELSEKYDKNNLETANLLCSIARHFVWYETHGKNKIKEEK